MNKFKYLLLILCLFVTTTVYAETTTDLVSTTTSTTRSSRSTTRYSEKITSLVEDEEIEEANNYIEGKNGNNIYFIDDKASLLTEEERKQLLEDIKPISEYSNIGFISVLHNSYSTDTYGKNYYIDKLGYSNGTIVVIDMDNREIRIISRGDNNKIITSSKANSISDNTYKYATNKQYYKFAKETFAQIQILIEGGKIFEPMRITCSVFLSLTISAFICFFIANGVSKIRKASSKEIINSIEKKFAVSGINAVKTGVRRVYNPPSESSSGGSGGGGGGGGGGFSSGGHSF